MSNEIIIAIDAMGGDKSPKKIVDGIEISLKKNNENFFLLFGDENILKENFSSLSSKPSLNFPLSLKFFKFSGLKLLKS